MGLTDGADFCLRAKNLSAGLFARLIKENKMNIDCNALKKSIAENKDTYIELEKLLTSHKALAPENGGDGELEKCIALENFLRSHGITNLERFDAPDTRVSSGIRPNLVATIDGESNDYSIWIIAHMDVVPTGDLSLWNSDPWTVVEKDGKLFGRGVEDNQQGLVSAFAAAWAYANAGVKPAHTVKLLFAADEEVGSHYGVIWLLENTDLFKKGDFVIIPDGGDSKGETIEVAEKNIVWFEFTTTGKQCHGSRPDEGKNACLAASDLALRLRKNLTAAFNKHDSLFTPDYSTFEPTMRKANVEGVNIIPGSDVLCFDCRILPCYSCDEVIAKADSICREVEKDYGVKISYKILQKAQSVATSKDALVVKLLSDVLRETHGIDAKVIGIGGGTVGAELRNKGFDCVVWSTLDETAHMPNEYCIIDNLVKDAQTLAVLMSK